MVDHVSAAVMQLLRTAGVPQSDTGECELDFDMMENAVLWELDHLVSGSADGHHGNGTMVSPQLACLWSLRHSAGPALSVNPTSSC